MWVNIGFHATFDVRCWLEVSRKTEKDLGLGPALERPAIFISPLISTHTNRTI